MALWDPHPPVNTSQNYRGQGAQFCLKPIKACNKERNPFYEESMVYLHCTRDKRNGTTNKMEWKNMWNNAKTPVLSNLYTQFTILTIFDNIVLSINLQQQKKVPPTNFSIYLYFFFVPFFKFFSPTSLWVTVLSVGDKILAANGLQGWPLWRQAGGLWCQTWASPAKTSRAITGHG